MVLRLRRRSALRTLAAAGAGPFTRTARFAAPASAATALGPGRVVDASDPGLGASFRATLAADLLSLVPNGAGLYPGRHTFLLPAAPWYSGLEPRAGQRAWSLRVPAGVPLYLLAAADPNGALDPGSVAVTIGGQPVPNLSAYLRQHGRALFDGHSTAYSVVDLLLLPQDEGALRIEVRVRYPAASDEDSNFPSFRLSGPTESVISYDLIVEKPDALSPLVLRDPAGRLWGLQGSVRRAIPDTETLRALGYSDADPITVSFSLMTSFSEGPAVPSLRSGAFVRAALDQPAFRLWNSAREWQPPAADSAEEPLASVIDAITLQTIPPAMREDTLLKGTAPDVFHVHRGTLRKVPDWKWVADRGLRPNDTFHVPDRVAARLPQNSPHWGMPGGSFQDAWFQSEVLGRRAPFRIYLPAGYFSAGESSRRYPVVYLLHGRSGRYDEWSGYGAEQVANELWYAGKLPPIIMVAPQGGLGYWMNQEGGTSWADYVVRDLVKHIDATYRTVDRREARAVGGLSMGGHGALQLAINFPSVFGVGGAHSPSLPPATSAPAYFGEGRGFARRDPLSLIRQSDLSTPPRLWIDTGARDPWRSRADELREAIFEKGWSLDWHVYNGEHNGWYWGDHIWEYLPFYGDCFVAASVSAPPAPAPPDW